MAVGAGWWVIGAVWGLGAVGFGVRWIGQDLRLRTALRRHVPVASPEVRELLERCRRELGLRRSVLLFETEEVSAPAIHGVIRPRLLIPDGLFERLGAAELRHVFLHELAHVKRRDLELNWLVSMLLTLHWFNPVLWWAFRRMRADRELATDAMVLAHLRGESPVAYGETILTVLEHAPANLAVPGLVGIGEDRAQMEVRIRAIAGHGRARRLGWIGGPLLAALAAVALTDARSPKPSDAAGASRAGKEGDGSASSAAASEIAGRVEGAEAREVVVRVASLEDDRAILKGEVVVEREYYDRPQDQVRLATDGGGQVVFRLDPSATRRLVVRANVPGYLATSTEWVKHQVAWVPSNVTASVSLGNEVGGRVTDASGRGLAGVEVSEAGGFRLMLDRKTPGGESVWAPIPGTPVAVTDADGRWRARCVWPKVTLVRLRFRKPGFAAVVGSTMTTSAQEQEGSGLRLDGEALAKGETVVVLREGVALWGRVVTAAGVPLPGASVRVSERNPTGPQTADSARNMVVRTDARGDFVIPDLAKKPVVLTVQEPGHGPAVKDVDLLSTQGSIEIRLPEPRVFAGIVMDRNRRPLDGVRLSVVDWGIWQGVRWEGITSNGGVFRWTNAVGDRFRIRLEKLGYITLEKTAVPEEAVEMTLDETLLVEGSVRDATTGAPVPSFGIHWAAHSEMLAFRRSFAIRGTNGTYRLDLGRLHEESWIEGYAHHFVFRLEAEGYEPHESRLFDSRKGDIGKVVYDVRLKPVPMLPIRVVDADDRPVEGAEVAVVSPHRRVRLAGKPRFELLDGIDFPKTDGEGRARWTLEGDGKHVMAVHERGVAWASLTGVEARAGITLKLRPWARVEGVVVEEGRPVVGGEVHLGARPFPGFPVHDIQTVFVIASTDAEGKFVFAYLPPTESHLYRMMSAGAGKSASGPQERVVLEPGMTATVRLGGRGRSVVGKMLVRNPYVAVDWTAEVSHVHEVVPKPEPPGAGIGDRIRALFGRGGGAEAGGPPTRAMRNYPVKFAQDGSFRIEDVEPGVYRFDIVLRDPRDPDAFANDRKIGVFNGRFEVADGPDRNGVVPYDLGVLEMSLLPRIEEGRTPAPDFAAVDLEGKPVGLGDFKGKYVLLDFWA
ncbi:MAG: carboxypeptidase regulatory-like domain-containing protein, partial [Verrucomicrobiales bacterium]|nr:carboxypeptidase regulatory-like domain-containing protein [Verrucomicrobiales bacterium]